jgi:hypothetical protein
MIRLRRFSLLFALAVFAAACADSAGSGGIVSRIDLAGLPPTAKFYVGQSLPLRANVYDAQDNLLTDVTVAWTSSDTSIAVVGSSGLHVGLLGKAPGPVTITATSQGRDTVAHLTVVIVRADSVDVAPHLPAGYVGMTIPLSARTLDSIGGVLADRPPHWTSSNVGKATISSTGLVTALGTGTVTFTATREGVASSTTILLLARPASDWSAVTDEWETFQGNAIHTGYVPATVDPVGFSTRWDVPLAQGSSVNPVTAGGGRIYASTGYFFQNHLFALDAASGNVEWFKDFGAINSVDPPAYADGSVYLTTGGQTDSFLWSFDAATGAEHFHSPYLNQWSRYYAPTIIGPSVYIAGGEYGGMYSFDAVTGNQRWFVQLDQDDEFTPTVRNGQVYAYTGVTTGALTVADTGGNVLYQVSDPAFVGGGYSMDFTPVLGASNDLLLAQFGRLISFDLQSRGIGWQVVDHLLGQVTVAGGVIYVRSTTGVEARRESDGVLLWSWNPTGETPQGTMIATRNLLFVSTNLATYAIDLSAHLATWSSPLTGSLALSKDGLLLIAQANGRLTAIEAK